MKDFSIRDKWFIIRNQDRLTLGEIACKLRCDWKEIYAEYSELIQTQAYADWVHERKPKRNKLETEEEKEDEGCSRTEDCRDKKGFNYRFLEKHYNISGYHTIVGCYGKLYWK